MTDQVQQQTQPDAPLTSAEIERHIYEVEHDDDIDPNTLADRLAYLQSFCRVETEADATEAVRMIRDAEEGLERAKAAAAAYVKVFASRYDARLRIYGPRLEQWAADNIPPDGKKKSKKLLSGTVGFRRKPGGALEIVDDLALREWVERELPQALCFARAPLLRDEIKAHITRAGIVPPGARLSEEVKTFYIGG